MRKYILIFPLILLLSSCFSIRGVIGLLDPLYQWNLVDIGIENAWSYSKGNHNITVAIIDSGVDFTHPDLLDQSWNNPYEIPNNGLDDDNNGYIDDTMGWDFRDGDNDPSPGHTHGTFIAGLIAADDDGDISVGVAPNIRIMALRFLKDDLSWSGPPFADEWPMFIEAINYAVDNNADVIHLSVQANGIPPSSFHEAIKRAYQNQIPIVSVTGNIYLGKNHVMYPGNYSEVIAVSATTKDHELADFSCFGVQNEICAPGKEIYSIEAYNNEFVLGNGTSYAAPLVSGAIALMLSLNNNLSIQIIRSILHETSTDLGTSGKDDYFGYGLLNVSAALENVTQTYGTTYIQ
ncbi:MAG: S8 family serine peptidase, partial [Candidatus Hodarchaeota archaeon]